MKIFIILGSHLQEPMVWAPVLMILVAVGAEENLYGSVQLLIKMGGTVNIVMHLKCRRILLHNFQTVAVKL